MESFSEAPTYINVETFAFRQAKRHAEVPAQKLMWHQMDGNVYVSGVVRCLFENHEEGSWTRP